MNQKLYAILLMLVITSLNATAFAETVMRIGYQKSATLLVVLKGQQNLEQRLAQQGVTIKWVEFPGGPQLLEGLSVGAIDFGFTGETPPIFAQVAGADLVYIGNEPASPAAEAILVANNSTISSVDQLAGKRIALNKGSNVHYLLIAALGAAGLNYRDITPVYLSPSDARAAFANNRVDAWVIWDPYLAAVEQQLNAKVLRDGSGIVNNYQFYLATKEFANNNPQLIHSVLEELQKVAQQTTQDPQQAVTILAPLLGLPAKIVHASVVRQKYGVTLLTREVIASQQKIADTFYELKLIPHRPNIEQVVWHADTQQSPVIAQQ